MSAAAVSHLLNPHLDERLILQFDGVSILHLAAAFGDLLVCQAIVGRVGPVALEAQVEFEMELAGPEGLLQIAAGSTSLDLARLVGKSFADVKQPVS